MSVGYVKFPSIATSTLVSVGNLIGVNILYVTPLSNSMVALVEKFPDTRATANPGVSSCPAVCGTTKVVHANADADSAKVAIMTLIWMVNRCGGTQRRCTGRTALIMS